jgi:hypothetical protein
MTKLSPSYRLDYCKPKLLTSSFLLLLLWFRAFVNSFENLLQQYLKIFYCFFNIKIYNSFAEIRNSLLN